MNIPEQLKPLSQKGKKFIEDSALAFASIAKGSAKSKKNDELSWDYFNGKIDAKRFKYLTQIGDYTLPSRIRRVSIQRPPINLLLSQQARRPFVFSTVVADQDSIEEKFKNKFFFFVKKYLDRAKELKKQYQKGYVKLQQQQEQIMQALQQEPQNEEQAAQLQELSQRLPEIQVEIESMKEEFQERLEISGEEISKIEEFLSYDYKELKEMIAQKAMKQMQQKHDVKQQSLEVFRDKIVTGKGAFYVDVDMKSKKLMFESLDSMQVYFPAIQGIKYIEEGPWVVIEDYISYSQLIDYYGGSEALTDEILKELEYYKEYSSGDDIGQPNANVYTGARDHSNGISRKRIWWKSPRKVFVKKSPNKHKENGVFRHFINDESYLDKKPKKEDGVQISTYYIYDLFTAVVIQDKIIVEGERVEQPLRMVDNYSWTQLPVIGKSFGSLNDEPYSLIWSTKDLQDLYDIVNYHRELYIAASGVKGQIIDLAQKPSTMSLQEHQYHKKLGNLYIETVDKAGRKVQSPYNQWKEYDDSLSPNIQYLEGIMQSLSEMVKETMGVTRQRMGQIVNSDQVGTSELARDQSALVTEILFYEHDLIMGRALRRALNLSAKFLWKQKTLLQFTNPDLSTEIVNIPENLLNKSDWDIFVINNQQEEQNMYEIKQLAVQQHTKGMLPFKHIIQMYNKSSVIELQKSVMRWSDEAEKLMMANQQNAQQAQNEAEQMKIRMEQEFQALIAKDKNDIERLRMQIDQAKLQADMQNAQTQAMLKDKEIDTRKETEMMKMLSNRDVEMNYLNEQTRNNQVQEQIKILQLKLQELQIRINEALGTRDQGLKNKEIEVNKNKDKNRIKN